MSSSRFWWPRMPWPARLYVTTDMHAFPSLAPGADPGGRFGDLAFTMESVAGLMARAVNRRRGDAMLWIGVGANADYARWLKTVLRYTNATRVDLDDPLTLVRDLARSRQIGGYVLYRADRTSRAPYDAHPERVTGYTTSANAATCLCALYNAILVEESSEALFAGMGLSRLADARTMSQESFFQDFGQRCRRDMVCVLDPKAPDNRGYAIATGSLVTYGVTPGTEAIYRWLKPNSPVVGWNAGDEYSGVEQMSRHGLFLTASNWCTNLTVLATMSADQGIPPDVVQVNRRSMVDPLSLDWPKDTHFTSFVMSDGDNLQWYGGNFFHHPFYWSSPARGRFPFGWTAPLGDLCQVNVPALLHMTHTATPNDQAVMAECGYFYPDLYGAARRGRDRLLAQLFARLNPWLARCGVRVVELIAGKDWQSPQSRAAYQAIARAVDHLDGMIVIQYYPYNGGKGRMVWVTNKEGAPIPVISARYALWAHLSHLDLNGPPALIADYINDAPHSGPVTEAHIDWTIVHAWSRFRRADTRVNRLAEEMSESEPGYTEQTVGGVEPVSWCVDRLKPHVRVVTPHELVWRARLHLRTNETLWWLANAQMKSQNLSGRQRDELRVLLREWTSAPLDTDSQKRDAWRRFQDCVRPD